MTVLKTWKVKYGAPMPALGGDVVRIQITPAGREALRKFSQPKGQRRRKA